jgi:hypothetical protein
MLRVFDTCFRWACTVQWANAYAEHGADGRYNSKWSLGIWYSLLFVKTAAIGTIVKMVLA